MATYFSILAWRILWTGEPGGIQFIGSQSWIPLKLLSTHAQLTLLPLIIDRSVHLQHFYPTSTIC